VKIYASNHGGWYLGSQQLRFQRLSFYINHIILLNKFGVPGRIFVADYKPYMLQYLQDFYAHSRIGEINNNLSMYIYIIILFVHAVQHLGRHNYHDM